MDKVFDPYSKDEPPGWFGRLLMDGRVFKNPCCLSQYMVHIHSTLIRGVSEGESIRLTEDGEIEVVPSVSREEIMRQTLLEIDATIQNIILEHRKSVFDDGKAAAAEKIRGIMFNGCPFLYGR